MGEKIIYKTSFNWMPTIAIFILLGSMFFFIKKINYLLGFFYILVDVIVVLTFIAKKFIFYENRVEIVRFNGFSKKRIFRYNDLLKIVYLDRGLTKTPPEIAVITKENPKNYMKSFMAPSSKKTKVLLKELHDLGVKIEINDGNKIHSYPHPLYVWE